jgi:nitronate monooxygenase
MRTQRKREEELFMPLPNRSLERLRLPVIGSPLFIVSGPDLVIAQCKAGIVGSFPAMNARGEGTFEQWVVRITSELAAYAEAHPDRPVAPFAVNHIIHPTNVRLEEDLEVCARYKVPVVITSLQAPGRICEVVHSYGGIVFHDVINVRHARRALQEGVDGLIAVCAGAGGHGGRVSPFALVTELREFFDGPIAVSGGISTGAGILAAQAMGGDFAYMGTRFIPTEEANAIDDYKNAVVTAGASDIVYTNLITGVDANFLRVSIQAAGLDPDNLPVADKTKMNFGSGGNMEHKAWRDIWGAGHSVAGIRKISPVADVVDELEEGYQVALARMQALSQRFVG